MKTFLKIQSKGEIETEAFTLIGASSKRNDATKIGYFGSGLKYSIAALLRNNIEFKIFQGETEIKFGVTNKAFRGEKYEAITVNGVETSMTTTMGGSDWDIAFAPFREIYSNAIDEDEEVELKKTTDLFGEKGTTSIFIECTISMNDFYQNINEYFCNKNPNVLASNSWASIYPKASSGNLKLFRKGILCYEPNEKSLFSYNSGEFTINESRVLSHTWSARSTITNCWKLVADKSLIKEFLGGLKGGNAGYYEHTFDFTTNFSFSNEWYEVCKELKFVPAEAVMFCKPRQLEGRMILPKLLLIPLFRQFQDLDVLGLSEKSSDAEYVIDDEPSQELLDKVIDALEVLRNTNYSHRLTNIDIVYANFIENSVLGKAENGKIILSTKLDCEDLPYIAKIIIEENEHNKSGFADETRSFQNHLFKLYYSELTSKK